MSRSLLNTAFNLKDMSPTWQNFQNLQEGNCKVADSILLNESQLTIHEIVSIPICNVMTSVSTCINDIKCQSPRLLFGQNQNIIRCRFKKRCAGGNPRICKQKNT